MSDHLVEAEGHIAAAEIAMSQNHLPEAASAEAQTAIAHALIALADEVASLRRVLEERA